jgi:myo-inositol 2-dehydrogenase/D-chiro-inositol 1-dehydrogenase
MTLRVGVIGTGAMGSAHVRTLETEISGAAVVAVSDPDIGRASALARENPGIGVHPTADALIGASDVDAVLIAAPDDAHERLVLTCLDAGKPVLCEKPLAATVEGCLRIVERELAQGRRLIQVGYMRRFDPAYVELKRTLRNGGVGAALMLHCVHRNAAAMPWFTSAMPILNSAVHELDVIRWLLSTDIARVSAYTPPRSSFAAAGLTDPRLLVVETASGVVADIEIFVNARYGYDVRCELVGETGTVSLVPPARTVLRTGNSEGIQVDDDFRTRFADAYREQRQAWVAGTTAGRACGASAWDGYAASVAANACLRAADERRTVTVTMPERPDLYEPPTEEACVITPSEKPI